MATLREIKRRISSVDKTKQMTAAMKTVAAVKVRNAQQALFAMRPYAANLAEVIARLSVHSAEGAHYLLQTRPEERTVLVVITSDRGLCGAFNNNIIKAAVEYVEEHRRKYKTEPDIVAVGRKGRDALAKTGFNVVDEYVGFFREMTFDDARIIGEKAISEFEEGDVDRVDFLYPHFFSTGTQEISVRSVLPIKIEDMLLEEEVDMAGIERYGDVEYLFEPTRAEILTRLLPLYVNVQVWRILQESVSSEHGARMMAMEQATSNCEDILGELTLHFNKARQAAITKELLEVASTAEAIK
jgi:F-type H+-transporting ATPase subunit gamma